MKIFPTLNAQHKPLRQYGIGHDAAAHNYTKRIEKTLADLVCRCGQEPDTN